MRYFLIVFCLAAFACGDQAAPCVHGAPSAMFTPDMSGVVQHHFEVKDRESVEELMLERGILVKVLQTGCTELRQEFQFQVPGDYSQFPDSMWLKEAVRQFYQLGNLSEKTTGLKTWASVMENARSEMRLTEPIEVEKNIFVQVDKVVSPESSTLRVVLLQK
jgi:hypothetical protein